ncbi:MAG TPA: DNA repair protein RecO [Salegentibacter sp.]|uniref:DNA repair protein RecO n=1 Tax=Salegentibacter sp. TaxID=1903072 RepID=UPI002F937AFD
MLVTTKAIVISALKYAEADLIVKAYTFSDGLKTYMLKGVLKSRKGKFKASLFQPLTQLEIVAKHRGKGTMEYLTDARLAHHYKSLHTDVVKSALIMFLAEVLRNSIQEEEPNQPLFNFLDNSFLMLDQSEQVGNFHLLFLLKLSVYLGFSPDTSQKDLAYFNLLEGSFQQFKTNEYCIEGENVEILSRFLGINFDEISRIKLNQSSRRNFLNMLLLYYELHIEGFKKPRSLSVFNEIFN